MLGGTASVVWGVDDTVEALKGEFDLPMIAYTPFAIFSNTIPVFDINFFKPNDVTEGTLDFGQGDTQIQYASESSAAILQSTIATWYVALRNIALVGLLSVLVYIGIRILTGSVSEKAKYKERLIDWLVAMCILFVIHYVMVFIVQISQEIGNLFASNCSETILVDLPVDTKINGEQLEADPERGYPVWACTFIGYARLIAGGFSDYDTIQAIQYTIIYVVLVIYTVVFTIVYLKRVLYMAFLTMIAPLVALTYPIDKITDGKAQGFDTWLKEYIFNALLQPFHLLIYTIVIGSVMELAIDYPIYAVVALGFLIPAEKLLRKMFGFEKAQSPATMGALGVAGAGLLMSGINKLTRRPKGHKEDYQDNKTSNDKLRMKTDDFDSIGTYVAENSSVMGGTEALSSESGSVRQSGNSDSSEEPLLSTPDAEPLLSTPNSETLSSGELESLRQVRQASDKQSVTNNKKPKRSIKNRLGNAVLAVGTRYSRKFAKSHPLRSLRRGVTSAFGGASLAMFGLAAGIASGDLGKTAQYTATAGLVGSGLAKEAGEALSSSSRNNINAFRQGWYGEEWQDKVREKNIRDIQSNPDNIQYLRERTSDYRKLMKEAFPEYAKYGCNNIEDFWAAYQLEKSGASRSSAISTYQLAQRTGDISKSPDAESKWAQRLDEEFGNNSSVRAQQQAEQERITKQFEEEQKKVQEEYERLEKEIEASKRKDREAQFKKLREERAKKEEALNKQLEERKAKVKSMPSSLTASALESVKQFYRNK